MSEENNNAVNESEMEVPVEETTPKQETYTAEQVENLLSALRKTRDELKFEKKNGKEKDEALKKFEQVNPDEFFQLQEERAQAEREQRAADERAKLMEQKYGAQAKEAHDAMQRSQDELAEFQKRYALEKVFFAAGGRTDAEDGDSFFDMFADKMGKRFSVDSRGLVVVIDDAGDPVLDKETGKRIDPQAYIEQYKNHRIFGAFFKGTKGSGSGLGYSNTDASGLPGIDLSGNDATPMFQHGWG